MIKAILLFILGLILLIKGGDFFVDGATEIARKYHVPELLIGATIVSIGTTLPEVLVSSEAAIIGHGEIAYGNAIGSIICNTSLISAITMLIRPSGIDKKALKIPAIFFFVAAIFYSATAYITGYFSRIIGIILLGIFAIYLFFTIREAFSKRNPTDDKDTSKKEDAPITGKMLFVAIVKLVIGAACIAIGANLLVDNGTIIARELGVPESVIGLTIVALGTSLPELVTAITALAKGHSALSVGNIIGANLLNLVLVSGLATTLSPFKVPSSKLAFGANASLVVDIPLMFIVMIIMIVPSIIKGQIKRWQGALLLTIYTGFCIFQFL